MALSAARKRKLFRDLDQRDFPFMEKVQPFLKGLHDHYFRCDFQGWENLPDLGKEKKLMFVGNHNGLLTFEILMLFYSWYQKFGTSRKALGLAHGIALDHPFFRWLCPRIGAIPADPEFAGEALERGFSLLVYPGGEKESFRPFKDRKKIDFYQRKGFVRLALKTKTPIVPIVSVGAHESYVIINRGEEIAEALGLKKRFRLHGVPITYRSLFFLWCVATGLFTFFPLLLAPMAFASIFVPMPAKMTFRILPPIDAVAMVDPNLSDEANHQRIYDHVLETMRRVHDAEYALRKYPILG